MLVFLMYSNSIVICYGILFSLAVDTKLLKRWNVTMAVVPGHMIFQKGSM